MRIKIVNSNYTDEQREASTTKKRRSIKTMMCVSKELENETLLEIETNCQAR